MGHHHLVSTAYGGNGDADNEFDSTGTTAFGGGGDLLIPGKFIGLGVTEFGGSGTVAIIKPINVRGTTAFGGNGLLQVGTLPIGADILFTFERPDVTFEFNR